MKQIKGRPVQAVARREAWTGSLGLQTTPRHAFDGLAPKFRRQVSQSISQMEEGPFRGNVKPLLGGKWHGCYRKRSRTLLPGPGVWQVGDLPHGVESGWGVGMPISHILAEGIGPFKKVHLDLRGPDGHPSLGPHILAGVNGSGKSTILKAIAWCLAGPQEEFADTNPRVLLIFEAGTRRYAVARTNARAGDQQGGLWSWANETMAGAG